MIVYFDGGFKFVKALCQDKRVIFPSVAGETNSLDLEMFGNGTGLDLEVNGTNWLLGEKVYQQSLLKSDLQNSDWVLSENWRAMLMASIAESTSASHVNVEVVTGLPFGDYVQKDLRERFKQSLLGTYSIKRHNRDKQQVTISSVKILTQNFAPLFVHIENLFKQTGYVGVLNIGGHTVEVATVELNAQRRPEAVRIQCGSVPRGVITALDSLSQVLKSELPTVSFNEAELDTILQTGKVKLGRKEFDASSKVETIKRPFYRAIEGIISNYWLSDQKPVGLSKLSTLIVTGGGAHLVGDYISKWLRSMPLSPEVKVGGQWDVVNGYAEAYKVMK